MRTIWYLDTPESVREAARCGWFDEQTAAPLQMALLGSAHQDAAIAAMKQWLSLPGQAVTPLFIQTLALMESGVPGAGNPYGRRSDEASAATEQQLRGELGGVVERKQGAAKAISL